jgi:hypothetical protein
MRPHHEFGVAQGKKKRADTAFGVHPPQLLWKFYILWTRYFEIVFHLLN